MLQHSLKLYIHLHPVDVGADIIRLPIPSPGEKVAERSEVG